MSHMNWKPLPDHHRKRLNLQTQLLLVNRPAFLQSLGNLNEHAHHLEVIEEDGNLIAARSNTNAGVRTMLPQEQGSILIQQQRTAIHAPFERGARLLVLSGIGVGHSLLLAQTDLEKCSSAGVIAWEFDSYAWTAFFALFDARRIIENTNQIFLFSGETIHEQTDGIIQDLGLQIFPSGKTAYLLGTLPVSQKYTERYIEQAKSLAQKIQDEGVKFDPAIGAFLEHIKTPLSGHPQSVWSSVAREAYIHFPIAQAFLNGFEEHGLKTHLEPFDEQFGRSFQVLGNLFECNPECIFTINLWPSAMLYDLGLPKETIEAMDIPRVCWMVDDTLLYADEGPMTQLGGKDFMFCCDRTYLPRLRKYPCHAEFLPPATTFQKPGTPTAQFTAEISYVGSLPNVNPHLQKLPQACREILERIETLRNQDSSQSFVSLLDSFEPAPAQRTAICDAAKEFCNTTKKGFTDSNSELAYFLYSTVTYYKRLRIVQSLLPVGIRVFGPSSWREALGDPYQDRYGGWIEIHQLADCYASSKICLNIHSHQCPTCLNTRDFDVPMAGSVVLGDWVEDVENGYLEPNKEILVYHTVEEMLETAKQYLRDPDGLEAIRMQGQKRVQQEHTYTHRAQTVLHRVENA